MRSSPIRRSARSTIELGARWKDYDAWQRAQQAAGRSGASPGEWSEMFRQQESGGRSQYYATNAEDLEDLFGSDRPYSDFFETFFSGGRRSNRPRRGRDIEAMVEVELSEAITGSTRLIDVPKAGGGSRRIEATIPAGVDDDTRIRLAGQGEPGENGGQAGDLFLVTHMRPDPRFERTGANVKSVAHASFTRMLLGGEIEVVTPTGRVALKIPSGTTDGQTFRLRGQGMPRMGAAQNRGDLQVEVHATLPSRLSDEQRKLVESLATLEDGQPASESAA